MCQKQEEIWHVPGSASKVPQEHLELLLLPEAVSAFQKSLGETVDKSYINLNFSSEWNSALEGQWHSLHCQPPPSQICPSELCWDHSPAMQTPSNLRLSAEWFVYHCWWPTLNASNIQMTQVKTCHRFPIITKMHNRNTRCNINRERVWCVWITCPVQPAVGASRDIIWGCHTESIKGVWVFVYVCKHTHIFFFF